VDLFLGQYPQTPACCIHNNIIQLPGNVHTHVRVMGVIVLTTFPSIQQKTKIIKKVKYRVNKMMNGKIRDSILT
jgi:hypothetical protein